jgi:hypothetical protein
VLVPDQKSLLLCSNLNSESLPTDLSGAPVNLQLLCGVNNEIHIIEGAQHMLDFGLCVGSICFGGQPASETRIGVTVALIGGFD